MAQRDELESQHKDPAPRPIGQLMDKAQEKRIAADDYDDRAEEVERNPGQKAAMHIM